MSMVLEMNKLNGIFYKREMFQPKYHWVETKYLGVIYKTDVGNFSADVIMLFLNIRWHLRRQLPRANVN